jgi:hypothetical protein
MNFNQLINLLSEQEDQRMHFALPGNSFIPDHFHITEVGLVQKKFIDCGGTVRSVSSCLLQAWVSDDFDHRLKAEKLLNVLQQAESHLEIIGDLPIEIEYEDSVISQYEIIRFEQTSYGLLFYLATKHTACLAPEKCLPQKSCCGSKKGCC